ncbi:MAG: hypothetical protein MI725_15580 [Pirellulales bacterium]|nr:hypothetical protein [Pirellulales bacterium]
MIDCAVFLIEVEQYVMHEKKPDLMYARQLRNKAHATGIADLVITEAASCIYEHLREGSVFCSYKTKDHEQLILKGNAYFLPKQLFSLFCDYGNIHHEMSSESVGLYFLTPAPPSGWFGIGGSEDCVDVPMVKEGEEIIYLDGTVDGTGQEKVEIVPSVFHWLLLQESICFELDSN